LIADGSPGEVGAGVSLGGLVTGHVLLDTRMSVRTRCRLGDAHAGAGVRRAVGESVPHVRRVRAVQYAVAEALALPDAYFEAFRADMRAKRDVLAAGLREAGFEGFRTAGTYSITTDITPFGEKDACTFCRALPERCGVVAVPESVFYDGPGAGRSQVRFTFRRRDDLLGEAASRLRHLASRIGGRSRGRTGP
jgi:hypothetical protein